MQKFMKKRKARGFTLIELLIVIIIIGILAGALLLAAGAGTDKATATKIVSDMRSIKTAAVMKYADDGNWDWISGDVGADVGLLLDYLDRNPNAGGLVSYDIVESTTDSGDYFVEALSIPGGISDKLKDMAEESGIYNVAAKTDPYDGTEDNPAYMVIK